MERTVSHRDRPQTARGESPRRDAPEIIFSFGPPASAAAQRACRAVAARDGVDADEAWVRVGHEVFDAMNEAGPQVESELDVIVSRALRTPVFVFGAVPNRCYLNGSACPALQVDLARIVDHYGNPVGAKRFGEKVVKGIMAEIADKLGAEWVRAALMSPDGRKRDRQRSDRRRLFRRARR